MLTSLKQYCELNANASILDVHIWQMYINHIS